MARRFRQASSPIISAGSRRPRELFAGRISAVMSPRVWRLSHLGAKLAFLRAGLGFGTMPLHLVEADLASVALVQIAAEDVPSGGHMITMSAAYRTDSPPGPAGRWFIERLTQEDVAAAALKASRPAATSSASSERRRSPLVRSRREDRVVDGASCPRAPGEDCRSMARYQFPCARTAFRRCGARLRTDP